jgi:hypothetical protein
MKFSIFFSIVALAGIWYGVKITAAPAAKSIEQSQAAPLSATKTSSRSPSSEPAAINSVPTKSPDPQSSTRPSPPNTKTSASPVLASLPPATSVTNQAPASAVLPLPRVVPSSITLKPREINIDATTEGILNALVSSIVSQESSGNYSLKHPVSGALGMGQVLPSNLPEWTTETFGREVTPDQFLASQDIQYYVIRQKLLQYYLRGIKASGGDLYIATRRVAAQWYSGQPEAIDSVKPVATGPSVQKYTFDILGRFQNFYPQNYTLKY